MKMIIGGAFQGKTRYAKEQYPDIRWIHGEDAGEEELLSAEGILGFQNYIRNELKQKREVTALAEKITAANPDVVIVSEEVGYGVVPVDAFEREYREAVGRVCTKLASSCETVTRVVCGLGMVIKDA